MATKPKPKLPDRDLIRIKATMAKKKVEAKPVKTYEVWLEISEHDPETDKYQTMDAPGAELRTFRDYDAAYAFAERVTKAFAAREKPLPACRHLGGYWIQPQETFRCFQCGCQFRVADLKPNKKREIVPWEGKK